MIGGLRRLQGRLRFFELLLSRLQLVPECIQARLQCRYPML